VTIKDIKSQLDKAVNPIVKVLHKNDHFKVLIIGFNKGMVLKDHKTMLPAKLTILEGAVNYREGEKLVLLEQYDEISIPVNVLHSVEALKGSICLLTQG
jgi:quercetin dioxygenase-like cupin family protein